VPLADDIAAETREAARKAAVEEFMDHYAQSREDWEAYRKVCEEAAVRFLDDCSLEPTQDAIEQLTEAFLPALAIMCQRGYDPNGANWKSMGWRGLLQEMHKRWKRIHANSWKRRRFDPNNTVDLINYSGYLLRSRMSNIAEWGDIGVPDDL